MRQRVKSYSHESQAHEAFKQNFSYAWDQSTNKNIRLFYEKI